MGELIFLDVETTGLNQESDKLVELTYGTEGDYVSGRLKTLYFGVTEVPEFIDGLIGFTKRGISGRKSASYQIEKFLVETSGATMVSANPKFDAGFLEANDLYKFHYRTLDIESYAMAKLDLDYVPGMKDIYGILLDRGYNLPEPNHTSLADTECLVVAYQILRDEL